MPNTRTPSLYAQSNTRGFWDDVEGDLGRALQRMVPVAFPGAPWQAFAGFATNGSRTGNTTQCPSETCQRQRFHELGYFGTPGGTRDRPAPDPNPNAEWNSYGRLAGSALVRQLLGGRSAVMGANEWQRYVDDQVAVGLADLLEGLRSVERRLINPAIRPRRVGSLWAVALAFAAWSAGPSPVAASINAHAAELAAVPEDSRWQRYIYLLLQDARSGVRQGSPASHSNPAYTALRTWQKLQAGKLIAERTGGDTRWFDMGFGAQQPEAERLLSMAAEQQRFTDLVPVPSLRSSTAARVLGVALVVGVAAAASYGVYRWQTKQRSGTRRKSRRS